MAFVPRLPQFLLSGTIHRLTVANPATWVADLEPVNFQLYFPLRSGNQVWLPDYNETRGQPNIGYDYQDGPMWIYALFPAATVLRDHNDLVNVGFQGGRDFLLYNSTLFSGARSYWIDLVEGRWEGFPNEHKCALLARRQA